MGALMHPHTARYQRTSDLGELIGVKESGMQHHLETKVVRKNGEVTDIDVTGVHSVDTNVASNHDRSQE